MTIVAIGLSAVTLLVMAMVMSYILGWANKAFHVEVDPRVDATMKALPGANCGGCGFVGCGDYAEAVVAGKAPVNKCTVGGAGVAQAIGQIMGIEVGASLPYRPIVHCGAHYADRLGRHEYRGESRCAAANLVAGVQGCTYGCLGFGDCTRACKFDAIHVVDGLAKVDYKKCVGCGACAEVCPRNIITITPFKAGWMMAVACANKDAGKDVTAVCTVGCIGCKACERTAKNYFKVVDNLSTINYEAYQDTDECYADLTAACKKCPRSRLVFVGNPTPKDLAAVADKELPEVVMADFKTTVDDTEWRG
ncbi:MAG: RnfABCDGE type electron transport complex subunit B [Desulfobacteraceae bacterium]|nr:RnfABCDGE type electron transport complex subunit B [Desulfobacteraceae bacterium]